MVRYNRLRRQQLRLKAIAIYGGKCACCGEATPEFLSFDHVRNDGAKDRRENGNKAVGYALYRRLAALAKPDGRYQLNCHNCNGAKGYYGICPHKRKGDLCQ
jgi:hypothetical protein